uniref:B-cell receptor CD22 first Ig-like domain-containing protein n=1 Tax=Astyanax mexicanus TaxID=7994 RepID=A0A3B1IKV3_ASTMX
GVRGEPDLLLFKHQHQNCLLVQLQTEDKWKYQDHPEDLTLDSDCTERVTTKTTSSSSTLTIRDLRKGDSGDYQEDEQFAGRVEFIGDKEKNCTLRITDVRMNDSGEYYFRINGSKGEKFSGKPGVTLKVTGIRKGFFFLIVQMLHPEEGERLWRAPTHLNNPAPEGCLAVTGCRAERSGADGLLLVPPITSPFTITTPVLNRAE